MRHSGCNSNQRTRRFEFELGLPDETKLALLWSKDMINLLSAATSTPQHVFKTTDLVGSMMHKLSPELINTINTLGVNQR